MKRVTGHQDCTKKTENMNKIKNGKWKRHMQKFFVILQQINQFDKLGLAHGMINLAIIASSVLVLKNDFHYKITCAAIC